MCLECRKKGYIHNRPNYIGISEERRDSFKNCALCNGGIYLEKGFYRLHDESYCEECIKDNNNDTLLYITGENCVAFSELSEISYDK